MGLGVVCWRHLLNIDNAHYICIILQIFQESGNSSNSLNVFRQTGQKFSTGRNVAHQTSEIRYSFIQGVPKNPVYFEALYLS